MKDRKEELSLVQFKSSEERHTHEQEPLLLEHMFSALDKFFIWKRIKFGTENKEWEKKAHGTYSWVLRSFFVKFIHFERMCNLFSSFECASDAFVL